MAGEEAPGIDPGADEPQGRYLSDYRHALAKQWRPICNYDYTTEIDPPVEPMGITWQGEFHPFPWTLPADPRG